jgi:hypothetical protein
VALRGGLPLTFLSRFLRRLALRALVVVISPFLCFFFLNFGFMNGNDSAE